VKSGYSKFLAPGSNILGGKHGSIGRRFITISLHLHSSGNTNKSFTSRKISYVHKCVVEGSKDVAYGENILTLSNFKTSNSSCVYSCFSSIPKRCKIELVKMIHKND
jgi:hypothetical protein